MDQTKSLLKDIFNNGLERREAVIEGQKKRREFENFISDETFKDSRCTYDEMELMEAALYIVSGISQKEDIQGFFDKVKNFEKSLKEQDEVINKVSQKSFLLLKKGEELSLADSKMDVVKVVMTAHIRWHKIRIDIESLSKEHNLPHTFAGGHAYVGVNKLSKDERADDFLRILLKKSETKGNFLKSILSGKGNVSTLTNDELKSFVISENKLFDLKALQGNPMNYKEDMDALKDNKATNTDSTKRRKI